GSSEGVDFKLEVPDEQKSKSNDTHEGTGLKLRVPDVSTTDSFESENESWGDSGNEANEQGDDEDVLESDDDHEQADDEWTEFDDDEEEETQDDEYTEGPILSSSISSDYAVKYLNFDNIPPVDTEFVSMLDIIVQHEVPRTSPLLTILVFVIPKHTIANPPEIVTTTLSATVSSLLSSLFPHL
ncbi:hypothetical protein Tco_0096045, partial [Tanacetum coccineum]